MDIAFEKIGLDYESFKKSKGKKIRHRPEKEVLQDLLYWINEEKITVNPKKEVIREC